MKVDDDGVIVLDSSSSNEDENEYERQPARQPARRAKPVTAQAARKSVLTSTAAPTVRGAFSSGKKIKAPVAARKAAPRAGYESENEHMEYIIREIISSGEDEQDDNDEEDAYDDGDTSFDESLAFDSKKRRRTNSSSAVRTGMPATKAKKSPKHLRKPQTPTKAPPRTGDVMKPSRRPRHFAEGSSEEESSDEDEDEFPFRRPPKAVVAMKSAERQQQTHKKQGHARPHGSSSSKYADVLSKSSVESPSEDEDAYARKPKKPAMQSSTKPSSREEKKAARKQEATPVMQQRPTTNDHSVAAASSARSSSTATRQADRESYAFTERISFSELQAQRRALEQIANQRRRATAASSGSSSALFSPPASSSSTTKSTAASARKSELFEFSQKKSIKRSRVDEIEKKVKAVVSPPASTPLVKATKEIPDVAPSPIADVTMSSTTTTSMTYTSQVSSRTSTYQSFGNQSDDHIRAPAMHGTTWRRLLLARSPPNILSPDSTYPLPFADEFDRPLSDFDPTGTLEKKSQVLKSQASFNADALIQEEVSAKVQNLITDALPMINACHERRVKTVLQGMRAQVATYFQEYRQLRDDLLQFAIPHTTFNLAYCERRAAVRLFQNRQLQAPKLNSLVGTVKYFMSGEDPEDEFVGDSLVFRVPKEREVYPETVIHINDEIPALRKSWAYVGVKKNVRVADDPILRYIPYLGENTRVNIDPNRYVSTTMDKNKRVEVLGSKSGSVLEIKSLPLSALDDEAMEYLLRLVVFECGDSKNVFNALQQSGKFFQPYSDYCEIKKNDDAARRVLKRVTGVQRLMNDKQLADDVSAIQTYLNVLGRSCWFLQPRPERQSVTDRLKPPIRYFESNYEQFPQGGGLRKTTDYNSSMEWYRDLFCRRCYTYDCDEHGIMQPTPMKRADPIYPVVLRAGIAHRRQKLPEAGNGDDGSAGKPIGLDESAQATDDVADLNMTITTSAAGVIELVDSSSEDEEQVEKDDDDDAQALASVSASDEESAVRRRSKRSQTRISTMASASLKVQEAMQEKERRQQRRADLKQWKKLTRAIDGSEYIDDSYVDIVTEAVRSLASTDTPCSFECWKKKKDMDANGSATIEKTRLLLSDNIETGPEQLENQPSADKQLAPVSHPTPPVFSESETLLLRKLASTLDDNSCLMAAMLKSSTCTCTKISQFLTTEQKTRVSSKDKGGNQNEVSRSADVSSHRRQKNDRHAGTNHSHSGTRELVRRTRMQRQLDKGNSHCYQPCNHEGVCDGCECMKRNHRCDKACACSRDCPNRFQGCKCSMGNCRTKSCPCYSAGRECDPDYCFSCGVSDAAVMGSEENPERRLCYDIGICCNSNLLRSAQRKIGVSFSTTHGWGAFALERIRRGEFLYEYTGALISDDEAERRGNIYDVMAISFLFDVNTDEVVDATRKGNKSKFANHKATVSANCEAKILLVNGEHRIALYARDDIEIGEELFFDYGYTHETAPQWSQVKQRGTQRHEISRHERDITQQFADEDDDDGDY